MNAYTPTYKIPYAYELKKNVARNRNSFWKSEHLRDLPSAPVYMFPDQSTFESQEVGELCCKVVVDWPHLPHAEIIFEINDYRNPGDSTVVYAMDRNNKIEAFLFARLAREGRWTDVLCHAAYYPEKFAESKAHPDANAAQADIWFNKTNHILWRSIALLQVNTPTHDQQVSRLRRGLLAGHGVSGWSYRVATIDLVKVRTVSKSAHGTHAAPRWHVRRGHWRNLHDGRRVFVRECEVGDQTRGGVIKDYQVDLGRAA